jgi:uncharacterized protein (UPF0332 family)
MTTTTVGMPVLLEEAYLRSAISRAYYVAFWRARALLEAEGIRVLSLDAHTLVIETLRRSPYRARMAIGAQIGQLRADRNRADYQRQISPLPELRRQAAGAIRLAGVIIAAIDRLTP